MSSCKSLWIIHSNFRHGHESDISILWKLFSLTKARYWSYSKTLRHFVLMCAQTWFACPLQKRLAKARDRWQLPKWFVAVEWGESQLFMISITVYLGKCQQGYCCVKTEHTHAGGTLQTGYKPDLLEKRQECNRLAFRCPSQERPTTEQMCL